jgi:hypothetical protein
MAAPSTFSWREMRMDKEKLLYENGRVWQPHILMRWSLLLSKKYQLSLLKM